MSKAPKRSTAAILAESLDIIKATYWIKGDEYRFEPIEDKPKKFKVVKDLQNRLAPDHARNDVDQTVKITGVCSIGAVALADMTLYDIPLDDYINIRNRDVFVKAAEAALTHSVLELNRYTDEYGRVSGVITGWNDSEKTERKHVLKVFKHALEGPLATAKRIWGWDEFGGSWASKTEAAAFRIEYNKAVKVYQEWEAKKAAKHEKLGLSFWGIDDVREEWPGVKKYSPLIGHAIEAFGRNSIAYQPQVLLEVKA